MILILSKYASKKDCHNYSVFNDWDALEILINDLSKYFYNISIQIQLLVVDDCSNIGNYPFHINSSKNIQIQILKLNAT